MTSMTRSTGFWINSQGVCPHPFPPWQRTNSVRQSKNSSEMCCSCQAFCSNFTKLVELRVDCTYGGTEKKMVMRKKAI